MLARKICGAMLTIESLFLLIMAWAALQVLEVHGLRGGDVGDLERLAWSSPFWGSAILFAVAAYLVITQVESDPFKRVIVRWGLLSIVGLENLVMLAASLNQAVQQQSTAFNLAMASLCGIVLLLIVASQASAVSALARGSARQQAQ